MLQTIRDTIGLHFALFKTPGKLTFTEDNELERVWLHLTTRASHSLQIARYALESGYYTQCFMLTRSVLEDWLTASDCLSNQATVEALLHSRRRVPGFKKMAERLPEEYRVIWGRLEDQNGNYGFLSTFAHPRPHALQATSNIDGTILIVPEYDEIRFALAALQLVQTALLVLDIVEQLADRLKTPAAQEWKCLNLKQVKPRSLSLLQSLYDQLSAYITDS